MLNTQDAILDAIWNEDIEGFPDKFRDENLKAVFHFALYCHNSVIFLDKNF